MTDWIIIPILAISGIIGYLLLSWVDRIIGRNTTDIDQCEREKESNEHTETGKPKHAHPGVLVFLHIER